MSIIAGSYTMGTWQGFTDSCGAAGQASCSFSEKISTAYAEKTEQTGTVSREEMSMTEYKQYISEKISRLPKHPSQRLCSVAVHISEEGFMAMKQDEEYEVWVIEKLREDFAFNDPWSNTCGGGYAVHYFGATKEEYRGQGWYPGYMGGKGEALFDNRARSSYWERRKIQRERQEKLLKKKKARKRLQELYYEECRIRRENNTRLLQGKKPLPQPMVSADDILKLLGTYGGI